MSKPLLTLVFFFTCLFQISGAHAQLDQLEQASNQAWLKAGRARTMGLPPGLAAMAPSTPACNTAYTACQVEVWVLPPNDAEGFPNKCAAAVALTLPITVPNGKTPFITFVIKKIRGASDTGQYEYRHDAGKDGVRMRDGVEFGRRYHGHPGKDIAVVAGATAVSETWSVKNTRIRDSALCAKEADDDGADDTTAVKLRRCEIHYAPYVKRKDSSGAFQNCFPMDPTLINKGP